MKKSTFSEYMPKKKNLKLLQVQLDEKMRDELDLIAEKEGWTLRQITSGVMKRFLEEYRKSK